MSKLTKYRATSPQLFHALGEVLEELVVNSAHAPESKDRMRFYIEMFKAVIAAKAEPVEKPKVVAK